MNNEMININANLVDEIKISSFIRDDKEVTVANFTLVKKYGEKTKFVEDMKKGDFVKISGEERYSTDEKGNEYLNVKAVYSKILKVKQQEKSLENKKESTLDALLSLKIRLVMNINLKIKKTKDLSYSDIPQGLFFCYIKGSRNRTIYLKSRYNSVIIYNR